VVSFELLVPFHAIDTVRPKNTFTRFSFALQIPTRTSCDRGIGLDERTNERLWTCEVGRRPLPLGLSRQIIRHWMNPAVGTEAQLKSSCC
jgi:hypothetical protein